jgi:hypothetical protein
MDAAMTDPNGTIPAPLKPPGAWFRELPEGYVAPPEGPLVQIDLQTGRVAALVAPYGECILDGRQGCWTPGMSKTGYEYAHVGSIITAEGETVRTANVGGGINHFDTSLATAASLAADHYANSATRRMIGRYMDVPDVGIMFLGSMYPGSTYMHAFEAMTSALSGDWRWIESMRDHEMVGSQLVNNPGFRPNPLRDRRPILASVSFKSAGAKVASATGCTDAATIISEWEPVVLDRHVANPTSPLVERITTVEAITASLMLRMVDEPVMAPPDPVNIMDLDDDGDEGEDWAEELADLTNDECRGCRGVGCERCGWLGYTGPDDEAMVAALRDNEALVAKLFSRRPKATLDRPRDGDGDGFVYDGTPRERPYNPLTDLLGSAVSSDILKRAASGDRAARAKVQERAVANFDMAAKKREAITPRKLAEATLGPRPKDPAGARSWDTVARNVEGVHSIKSRGAAARADDPDRRPGGGNPIAGRKPATPTEVAVDRAAKAKGRVTKAEARRSRGGADLPTTDTPEPLITLPDSAKNPAARRKSTMPDDISPVPEVRREGANRGTDPVLRFSVSDNAIATIKATRDAEDQPETLAVFVDRQDNGKYRMEFVDRDTLGDGMAVSEIDGVTFAIPAEDARQMEGLRLEQPTWGGGVAFVGRNDPTTEDADVVKAEWSDRPRPKKAQFKLPAEDRFTSWDDERLTQRMDTLNEFISTGGRGFTQPTGGSARTEFERRGIERLAIAKEMESRGLDVPEPDTSDPDFPEVPQAPEATVPEDVTPVPEPRREAANNPFATSDTTDETGGPIRDFVKGVSDAIKAPISAPDEERNSGSPIVRQVGNGGTPVDSIGSRGTGPRPDAPKPPPDPAPGGLPTLADERVQAGRDWANERGLLEPDMAATFLSADDVGVEPIRYADDPRFDWDPREGAWKRTSPVGVPRPEEIARQRAALEAELETVPGPDQPTQRAEALDVIMRGLGKKYPLLSTKGTHNGRGDTGKEYTAARTAVHDEIIEEVVERLDAAGVPRDKVALFTGGLPGSGKSFSLRPGQKAEALKAVVWELDSPEPPEVPEGYTLYVAVNSDWVKTRMAELGLNTGIKGLKPMEEASLMHSESSYIGERLERHLTAQGYNVAFDGTMGDEAKLRRKLDDLTEQGYAKPKVVFADITVEESAASAAARYRKDAATDLGGRFVPSDVAEDNVSRMGNFSMNRDTVNFLVSEGMFDEAIIIDNRGVSNSQAKTARDLDGDFPVPRFKAEELGLRVSDTPDKYGSFPVLDPEYAHLRVEDFAEVEGIARGGKWAEYDGVPVTELGPGGYPPRSTERVLRMPGVAGGTGTETDPFVTDDVNTAAILLAEGEHRIKLRTPKEVAVLMDRLKELVDEAKAAGRAAPTYDLCKISVGDNLFCAENKGYPRIKMPQLGTNAPAHGSIMDQRLASMQLAAMMSGEKIPDEINMSGEFMDHLRSRGIEVKVVQTPASHLRATQNELNGAKVAGMVDWKETAQAAAPKVAELNDRYDAGELTPDAYLEAARAAGAQIPKDLTGVAAVEAVRPQSVWTPRRIITTSDNYIVDGHHGWASDVAIQYGSGEEVMVESYQIDADIIDVLNMANEWAVAMGSTPQGAGGVGKDGLTDDQRRNGTRTRALRRRKGNVFGGNRPAARPAPAPTPAATPDSAPVDGAPEGAPGGPAAPVAVV